MISFTKFQREDQTPETAIEFLNQLVEEGQREKWRCSCWGFGHRHANRRALMYEGRHVVIELDNSQPPRENRVFRAIENQKPVLYERVPVPEFQAQDQDNSFDVEGFIGSSGRTMPES